ncbi:MAG TPA: hypothetical protein V6D29_24655 [Leptolyngbyaceae cyanobacterium]
MAKRVKLRRVNSDQYSPSASALVPTTPPRVSPGRVQGAISLLTVGAFILIAADCWMSWEGFSQLPVDWWIAASLTGLIAITQIGAGVIQSIGGDPFKGIGGSAQGDGGWGIILRGLYLIDIFSNFAGFGGVQYLSLDGLMADPLGAIGLILWNGVLAILLAFGDEILFRIRDRITIGAAVNGQLAKLRAIQIETHNLVLQAYREKAVAYARSLGERMPISFDWLEGKEDV